MNKPEYITIDNQKIVLNGERNILEVARKAGIDIPTFCYHSELSIYGACRLCLVEVENMGIVTSCSTVPKAGMRVKTNTSTIRKIRKINLELLLANHERECTSCGKSGQCELQNLARKLGVDEIRYRKTVEKTSIDDSSWALVRDPNKCVLCGDCVRFCEEIQSVGAIDFAFRGSAAAVVPAFGKNLADVDCVNCGQCARVCPTGAIMPKSEISPVWKDIDNPEKKVVAQVAPAIRVALGEYFGLPAGTITTGKVAAALKALGFDLVFDTCFAADLTVLEETTEFIKRAEAGKRLPIFTSCCPAWVKFAEHNYPDLLENISTCRSPQQMFGSLAKVMLPESREKLSLVSIMPCTAKKYEAKRPEFADENGVPDVDHVLTTNELGRMIEEAGIRFEKLAPASFDLPLGFKTGAGAIFGASGGVTEAVLRYASVKLNQQAFTEAEFSEVSGAEGVREAEVELAGKKIKVAVVYGLANARRICDEIREGNSPYALVEVMACPGGCVNGAGQPVTYDFDVIKKRGQSLYEVDKNLQLHCSQDNPYLIQAYRDILGGEIGGEKAHALLHTGYHNRRRISEEGMSILSSNSQKNVEIGVCVGTNCHLKGSQDLLSRIIRKVEQQGFQDSVSVKASFCFERCGESPVVKVGKQIIGHATIERVLAALEKELAGLDKKAALD